MKLLIFISSLLISVFAFTQSSPKCISIEGVHLGCVPSESHPCIRLVVSNPEEITESNPTGTSNAGSYSCQYIKRIQTERRNPRAGPLGMQCQSWKPGFDPEAGNETGIDRNAMCDVFTNPICTEVCELCTPEEKTYSLPYEAKGCQIISDGSRQCTGACRNRCGDEPDAGGVKHGSCGGPRTCGMPAGSTFVACRSNVPQCPATFPGAPGLPVLGIPPSPADPEFLSTKYQYRICSNFEKCPHAVNHQGYGIEPLPGGGFPECMTSSGQPVSRVNGSCPCLSGGSPVTRGDNGICPAGAQDSYPVTSVNVSADGSCPNIPQIEAQEGAPGPSCPWVEAFGLVRRDCEAIPCCCQFDPVTKKARTDCPGGCPGGCQGWIDENMGATGDSVGGGAKATGAKSSSKKSSTIKSKTKVKTKK